ncbi:MAG: hypothetical protein ACD_81C00212G0001 [uncultured bacterium]|uniref:Nucleotidyltransferase family protein n=1 Tax=Candidatus Wolfebacteria bacterium GW2011_GWE2_44_13 TaxID=1619017 RepID=A0A0G1K5V3_9BACT|nr:MAG: hypothetical protein ACD_81C00212G0001 [uncultured bacterium]KKT43199.1 MAG: hypothetical protein UW32_C0002G0060 [Candidatus Wolfebacteria bacterium GW2011_GWE2_44_13]
MELTKDKIDRLEEMLKQNKTLQIILQRADSLHMSNWYLGAGCISQTVWNILHGFDPEQNIKDYDLVYYDAEDITKESELAFMQKAADMFKDIPVVLDIVNEARVHLWVEEEFGYAIDQYSSVEEAISTWPTTITCVGVTRREGMIHVYAAFGLDDVFGMVLRPNKKLITEEVYMNKVKKWTALWPKLTAVGWNERCE